MDFCPAPVQSLPVYLADQFRVANGANMGDALSFAAELVLDDVYELRLHSKSFRLSLMMSVEPQMRIAEDTSVGSAGADIHFDSLLTFMSPDGIMVEAILLVEVDPDHNVAGIYLLALSPIQPKTEYRLVGIDTTKPRQKCAQLACVSFTRGTYITLASGEQRRIEDLHPGDNILTRDDGAQQVRWIGQTTLRATGEFAPILIRAGVLNNARDLIVSPAHRLFIYQRCDKIGAGRAELLVEARHLVNGDTVLGLDGGFVDYFQLLFDNHQIIYAEGIAAETLLIDPRSRPALPDELATTFAGDTHGHSPLSHVGLDVNEGLLNHPEVADLLRQASKG